MRKNLYFFVTLALLVTTIFSWFRINTWCIVLFGVCGLFVGNPLSNIKTTFRNKYFLAFLAVFLSELLGQLYTQDLHTGWNLVAKDATLVAIPFGLCSGSFADKESYKKVMAAYCLILAAASCWCIAMAVRNYYTTGDIEVLFYHQLVRPISQNAIFYTVFILFGLLFLLSYDGGSMFPWLGIRAARALRAVLIVFFCGMVLLLASKLFLLVLLLILGWFLLRRYSFRRNRMILILAGVALLLLGVLVVFTDNPIKKRYNDIVHANLNIIKPEQFTPGDYFNGIQLRLLEWRFAYEIVREHRAWIWGTGTGDSQDLLNQKYRDANMYMGKPGQRGHGFIGYNFHNQFIETFVRTGAIGLLILLILFWLMAGIACQWRTGQAFFTVLILGLFFLLQSPLTMQHGIFLFSYFPILLLQSPKNLP